MKAEFIAVPPCKSVYCTCAIEQLPGAQCAMSSHDVLAGGNPNALLAIFPYDLFGHPVVTGLFCHSTEEVWRVFLK